MYTRRQVTDHVTKMNKDLYDNLQDGIDEAKESIEQVREAQESSSGVIYSGEDVFSDQKTYAVGDLVIYNNTLYKCVTAVETPSEWNEEQWEVRSILEVIHENRGIKVFTVSTPSRNIATKAYSDFTLDISEFGFSETPDIFLSHTYCFGVNILSASSQSIQIRLWNLWYTDITGTCILKLIGR